MQLTDNAATAAKVTNPSDPRQSIFGGARYFQYVYAKIPNHIPEPDRTWFALAAYNIGYGHLEDARVLAQKAGRDPDSWDDVRELVLVYPDREWLCARLGAGAVRRQRTRLSRHVGMGLGQQRQRCGCR